MKKFSIFLGILATSSLLFMACSKDIDGDDDRAIQAYAAENGFPTPPLDTSGVVYKILAQGNSNTPINTSIVEVYYTCRSLSGTIYDQRVSPASPLQFILKDLIKGWIFGLPKIGEGGSIILLVPSRYAYGTSGAGAIPPNTPLRFDIELLSVN